MDAGDLETLRQYFDCLDRTQTGSLSLKDLWPVADALVLKLGNSARRSFLWVACKRFDRNHDGYVGFEEFCRMVSLILLHFCYESVSIFTFSVLPCRLIFYLDRFKFLSL